VFIIINCSSGEFPVYAGMNRLMWAAPGGSDEFPVYAGMNRHIVMTPETSTRVHRVRGDEPDR